MMLQFLFVNSTAFDRDLMEKFEYWADMMPPGCFCVTASKPLLSTHWNLLGDVETVASWGNVKLFIQQRKDDDPDAKP